MLLALLVCSDSDCAEVYEAWCDDREVDCLACELCGCALQAVSVSNVAPGGAGPHGFELQLRDAA
jgi:hypothetical protein